MPALLVQLQKIVKTLKVILMTKDNRKKENQMLE